VVFRCDAFDQLMYLLSFMSNFMIDLLDFIFILYCLLMNQLVFIFFYDSFKFYVTLTKLFPFSLLNVISMYLIIDIFF
jgi:hypothetical protein